jgi:uncharacterized 2Fe-2S/4Fe-4S cluster protein (DUF4445 family)
LLNETVRVELAPLGVSFEIRRGAALANVLAAYGLEFPCGGAEVCGGCRVRVLQGKLEVTAHDRQVFTDAELAAGWRLACQARAEDTLKLEVDQWTLPILADHSVLSGSRRNGLAIAVDLGTTTVVAQMVDLATGTVVGMRTALNPQTAYGADVMTRVRFALTDPALTALIRQAVGEMIAEITAFRAAEITEVVLVGNAVMHHLFAGLDIAPLSHVPFASPNLGEQPFTPQELNWALPAECRIRFLECLGGFVGSDILAGIVATGIARRKELMALIDLGTNGEIVLGNRERILCASTAAGPAFEAGSIRMGMRASSGAISRVIFADGKLACDVIGDVAPRGICGSGLVDAVAAGLGCGAILPSGRLANGMREFPLAAPVVIFQKDIRELQLAKGAIAAGLRILLNRWGATAEDIESVYLSGAFGNYVAINSAVAIGLLEAPASRIIASGNTALRGAKLILLSDDREPELPIEHVSLASDPHFEDTFIDCMSFPEAGVARRGWPACGLKC